MGFVLLMSKVFCFVFLLCVCVCVRHFDGSVTFPCKVLSVYRERENELPLLEEKLLQLGQEMKLFKLSWK